MPCPYRNRLRLLGKLCRTMSGGLRYCNFDLVLVIWKLKLQFVGLSFLIERLVPQNHSQIRYLYVLKSLLNFNGVNCGNLFVIILNWNLKLLNYTGTARLQSVENFLSLKLVNMSIRILAVVISSYFLFFYVLVCKLYKKMQIKEQVEGST